MAPQRLKQITIVTDFVAMQWYMVSLSWCVPQLCILVWCLPVSHVSLVFGRVHDNRIIAISSTMNTHGVVITSIALNSNAYF
jgi:hypothetical protein